MTISSGDFTLIGRNGMIATDVDRLSGIITENGGSIEKQMNDSFGFPSDDGRFTACAIWILCGDPACVFLPGECSACSSSEPVDVRMSELAGNARAAISGTTVDPLMWGEIDVLS